MTQIQAPKETPKEQPDIENNNQGQELPEQEIKPEGKIDKEKSGEPIKADEQTVVERGTELADRVQESKQEVTPDDFFPDLPQKERAAAQLKYTKKDYSPSPGPANFSTDDLLKMVDELKTPDEKIELLVRIALRGEIDERKAVDQARELFKAESHNLDKFHDFLMAQKQKVTYELSNL